MLGSQIHHRTADAETCVWLGSCNAWGEETTQLCIPSALQTQRRSWQRRSIALAATVMAARRKLLQVLKIDSPPAPEPAAAQPPPRKPTFSAHVRGMLNCTCRQQLYCLNRCTSSEGVASTPPPGQGFGMTQGDSAQCMCFSVLFKSASQASEDDFAIGKVTPRFKPDSDVSDLSALPTTSEAQRWVACPALPDPVQRSRDRTQLHPARTLGGAFRPFPIRLRCAFALMLIAMFQPCSSDAMVSLSTNKMALQPLNR